MEGLQNINSPQLLYRFLRAAWRNKGLHPFTLTFITHKTVVVINWPASKVNIHNLTSLMNCCTFVTTYTDALGGLVSSYTEDCCDAYGAHSPSE